MTGQYKKQAVWEVGLKPPFYMKSNKRVKELEEISLPYRQKFPVNISGGVNSDNYFFPKDTEVILTYSQYEALRHSHYEQYLKN